MDSGHAENINFIIKKNLEEIYFYLSIKLALMLVVIFEGAVSFNLNTDSITVNSVAVVSNPAKAHQSFTTTPEATTSLPLFTVPA